MTTIGFSDVLTLAQTIAIIGTLAMTLYFSRRQAQSIALDLETRVLNDLDEKLHHLLEIFVGTPELVKVIYNLPSNIPQEIPFSYYVLFVCSHVYHMRQRKVLRDNEWSGWLEWMKNAFKFGKLEKYWKEMEMGMWFDPSFRDFVYQNLISETPSSGQNEKHSA